MMKQIRVWLGALVLLVTATTAHASVPGTLLVEGTLANIAGAPVADGVYSVKFAIYGDAVSLSPLWAEGPVSVAVKSGGFSTLLGANKPLANDVLAAGTSPMLALTIGSDPELPRKPLASVPFALRAGVAEGLDCKGCVTEAALAPSVFDAINSAANLATVAKTGAWSDLIGTPTLVAAGQACAAGQAISGIDATGKVVCTNGAGVGSDPLSYVSNGALANVFPTTTNGNINIAIPDNSPVGISDSINITSGYAISTISVAVNISNSDISHLTVNLIAPDKSVIVLFNKNGFAGGNIATSFPAPTPVFSGDLVGWAGKSAKGIWQIQLIDSAAQLGGATNDGKLLSWSITLGYASANKVEVKGDLVVDGNLTVNGANNIFPSGAMIAFNSASCPVGWVPANGNNGTPNMAGRMPIGVGTMPYDNVAIGYLQSGGSNRFRMSVAAATSPSFSCGTNCKTISYLYSATADMKTASSTGNSTSDNTGGPFIDMMPPYMGVYWCVKQ